MEYNAQNKEIMLNRKLNELDKFVIEFIKILQKHTDYVIVSGYVSILLGRTRATEDVDLLFPKMDFNRFKALFKNLLNENFECANTTKIDEAYNMLNEHAIRFFKKDKPIPNIEFKMIKTDLDKYSFENKIKVIFPDNFLFISSLEMQIAFKLFLAADGTKEELMADKDIEDARYIYRLFKDKINKDEMTVIIEKLNAGEKIKWIE